ncbi:unnamed protein product, partial [Heterosigma akashiwo]
HLSDNYKDRSPGLHMWTLPFLVPTTYFMVHHQNFRQEKEREKKKYHSGSNCTPFLWQILSSSLSLPHFPPTYAAIKLLTWSWPKLLKPLLSLRATPFHWAIPCALLWGVLLNA